MPFWTCDSGIFRLLALSAHALDFPLSAVSYCYPFYPQHVSSYFSNAFLLKGLRIHFGIKILIIKFRNYVLPFLWPENTGFCLFVCLLFCLFSCRHFSNYPCITQSLEPDSTDPAGLFSESTQVWEKTDGLWGSLKTLTPQCLLTYILCWFD